MSVTRNLSIVLQSESSLAKPILDPPSYFVGADQG